MPKLTPVDTDPFAQSSDVKLTPVDHDPFSTDTSDQPRSFLGSMSARAKEGWDDLTNPVGDRKTILPEKGESAGQFALRSAKEDIPAGLKAVPKMMGGFGDIISSPAGAIGETVERKAALAAGLDPKTAEKLARNTGDVTKAIPLLPIAKASPKILEGGGKALGAVREAVNAKSDAMATKVPVTKSNDYIIKTLAKSGHSPAEIMDIVNRAKEHGLTVGEASNNPELLGMERKISGLNKEGGQTVRDFVKNRVDPANNVSVPFKLKSIADPLVKEVNRSSKEIGKVVESAPKTPLNMNSVKSSLASEARPAGSAVTNTLNRIDGLVDWAKSQGDTFAAWHRVKQEIYAIGKEASDPNAINKLDQKTVSQYYKKVNDVLTGKSPGLPKDLAETSSKYANANSTFHQNLSGRMIEDALKKMPVGGTPASSLKYLHKTLAGNQALQEELFEGMPASQRKGMLEFLNAINDAGRRGVGDVVKSMQEGSPSFPISTRQVLHKAYDKLSDLITRRDYDALGKALTSPENEAIAKKLGYVKTVPVNKPILRLTYQPKAPEIAVNRAGEAKIVPEAEQAAINETRDRMEKLGFGLGVLRAQDLNVIRNLETKYGQSELGKFMIANKNEPIMGRAWDVPQHEYSQATVDKMMGKDAMSMLKKLDKETRDRIDEETRNAWESHEVSLADMIMARRQAALDLAKEIGESPQVGSVGNAMFDAVNPIK